MPIGLCRGRDFVSREESRDSEIFDSIEVRHLGLSEVAILNKPYSSGELANRSCFVPHSDWVGSRGYKKAMARPASATPNQHSRDAQATALVHQASLCEPDFVALL